MTFASNGLTCCQEIPRLRHVDPVWLAHLRDYKVGTIFKCWRETMA